MPRRIPPSALAATSVISARANEYIANRMRVTAPRGN
jgi:hypothetical protein